MQFHIFMNIIKQIFVSCITILQLYSLRYFSVFLHVLCTFESFNFSKILIISYDDDNVSGNAWTANLRTFIKNLELCFNFNYARENLKNLIMPQISQFNSEIIQFCFSSGYRIPFINREETMESIFDEINPSVVHVYYFLRKLTIHVHLIIPRTFQI